MKGALFLSGGGSDEQSQLLDKEYLSKLSIPKILYIPIASARHTKHSAEAHSWLSNTLAKLTDDNLKIDLCLDLNRIGVHELNEYGGVYIGGGNTYHLLNLVTANSFDQKLIDFLGKGGVIYGGSAGAIIMGKSIATVSEENISNSKTDLGLDLVDGFSIRCHYVEADKLQLEKFINTSQLPIIGLPEDCGLVVEGENEPRIVGYSSAICWNKSAKWFEAVPGQYI